MPTITRTWRSANATGNSVLLAVEDMRGTHDAYPDQVTTFADWAWVPRVNRGNTPAAFGFVRAQCAATAFNVSGTTPPANTGVAIRNLKLYIKYTAGWSAIQVDADYDGLHYTWDYVTADSAPTRYLQADGSYAVDMRANRIFHWWPSSATTQKPEIDENDVQGVWAACEVRLAMLDEAGADNRSSARFICQMGSDWYDNLSGIPAPVGNDDIALARLKYVTNSWQWFNMTTLSLSSLQASPPPPLA